MDKRDRLICCYANGLLIQVVIFFVGKNRYIVACLCPDLSCAITFPEEIALEN